MKFFSLLILFTLSFNALASSGTLSALEGHIDNYQYALTVEWDQKNDDFYKETTDDFFNKLSYLLEEEGLSREDILQVAENKLAGRVDIDALKLKLSLVSGVNETSDLAEVLKENTDNFYQRGASWDGEVMGYLGIGLIGAALIGYAIWHSVNYECIEYDYRWQSGCDSSNCYEKYCKQYQER